MTADLSAALRKSHPALPSILGHTLLLLSWHQIQRLCGCMVNNGLSMLENQLAKKKFPLRSTC